MKEISITQGRVALVDDKEFERLSQYSWCLLGGKPSSSYAIRVVEKNKKKTLIRMHHLVLQPPKGMIIDHINGNGLDNRRANLRICTPKQNNANRRPPKNCLSKYKGVSLHKNKKSWRAYVRFQNKFIYLGVFADEVKAAKTYDINAVLLFGEFAWLNFPPTGGNRDEN